MPLLLQQQWLLSNVQIECVQQVLDHPTQQNVYELQIWVRVYVHACVRACVKFFKWGKRKSKLTLGDHCLQIWLLQQEQLARLQKAVSQESEKIQAEQQELEASSWCNTSWQHLAIQQRHVVKFLADDVWQYRLDECDDNDHNAIHEHQLNVFHFSKK